MANGPRIDAPTPPSPTAVASPPGNLRPVRDRAFWAWQLALPLLMLSPLLIRSGPGFFWSLGAVVLVAFFCAGALLVRLLRLLFRRGDPARLLRPALVLVVAYALMAYLQLSLREVREVAGAEAVRLQAECMRAGCPEGLTAGTGDDPQSRHLPTPTTHLTWPIRYRRVDDGFELYLFEGIDMSRRWYGGAEVELAYERIDDGRTTPLPVGGDGPPHYPED